MGIFFEKRGSDPQSPTTLFFFVAIVLGALMAPCVWCGKIAGIEGCENMARGKHYPGCGNSVASECERQGYEWDGTYRDEHPDLYDERER